MGYHPESMTVVGVELARLTARELRALEAHQNRIRSEGRWPAGSRQARFAAAEPRAFRTSNGLDIPFTVVYEGEDFDSRAGNWDENFGGYAGFDLSDLSLADRGRVAAVLPEVQAAIAERLTALGRPTDPAEAELREYSVIW